METLRPLFDGDEVVDLRAPDTMLWVLEEHSHRSDEKTHLGKRTRPPRRVFLGRQVAGGRSTDKKRQSGEKCFFHRYDLSQRAVLGPTTLDNELAFIMANCAGVRPHQLGMDPFCGTGGLLIAMAHFGAKLFGGEIDIRVVRGWRIAYTKNKAAVLDAARSRGLSAAGGGAPAAADAPDASFNMPGACERGSHSSAGGSGWSLEYLQALGLPLAAGAPGAAKAKQPKQPNNRNAKAEKDPALTSAGGCNIFTNFVQYGFPSPEIVVCDNAMPPWRVVTPGWLDFIITDPPYGVRAGAKKSGRDEAKKKVVIQDVSSYIPSKVSYGEEELSEDLLNFAAASLVDGGKLVFLVPVDLADFLGIDRAAVEQHLEGARPNFHEICHPKAGRKKDPRLCVSETTRDPLLLDESRYVDFIPQHVAFRPRMNSYAREPEFVVQSIPMPTEVMAQLSPFLSVQNLAPLRATCRQPASAGEEAFQQLLKLPAKRRHQIQRVDSVRSAEKWAELTKGKQDYKWHIASKRRFMCDISGEWVLYTPTGSIFDGLKEYLLLTHFLPAEPLPSKTEDILFDGKSSM
eukprot:s2696_g7.t1